MNDFVMMAVYIALFVGVLGFIGVLCKKGSQE